VPSVAERLLETVASLEHATVIRSSLSAVPRARVYLPDFRFALTRFLDKLSEIGSLRNRAT
jgi:hypothetical protein